ncbi:MAG: YihY/virulence factor BrkB family protein [Hamadaea sp.]|nr:YihY/virulence factor BrkB family protein [Hamadaea sp.]
MAVARKRSGAFDNFWAAKERYSEVLGGRLAAAIAYYGFFAAFALSLVAFSVFGFVFKSNDEVRDTVTDWLSKTLPDFPVEQLAASSTAIGVFGLVGLLFTGLGWVDAFRTSQRAMWRLEQHPGNMVVRRLVDLGMLLALMIVLAGSLAVADLLSALFRWISGGTSSIWLTAATASVTILVNIMISAALLTVLPRLHVSPARLIPPAIAVGLGLSLLNWGGRAYVTHSVRLYPAYTVIATTGVLLIYLYLFNQIVLWGSALAATSTRGRFIDLAAGPPPAEEEPSPEDRPEPPADSPSAGASGSPAT